MNPDHLSTLGSLNTCIMGSDKSLEPAMRSSQDQGKSRAGSLDSPREQEWRMELSLEGQGSVEGGGVGLARAH